MQYQYTTSQELQQQRFIELGYDVRTFEPVKIADYFLGDAWAVFGITSYGKSILVGNLAVQLAKHRYVIIFDYNGAYKNLKYVNYRNTDYKFRAINDLIYIHRFGFKLEDMKNKFDWEMMGFTSNAASLLASFSKQKLYHENNFNRFTDMVRDVKTFGKAEGGETWLATKNSILAKLDVLKSLFVEHCVEIDNLEPARIRYQGMPLYVKDWKAFVKKHRHICINMNTEYQPAKAQFIAGKIMNDIEPVLDEISPVLIYEEAHELIPKAYDKMPYSMYKLLDFLKEKHKKGVKVILISQSPEQISELALDEIKRFFFGKLQNIKGSSKLDEIFKLSMALNYNYMDNKREFWHYSPLYNERGIFQPYDSYTYYEKRK